jgi:hypothetical protein
MENKKILLKNGDRSLIRIQKALGPKQRLEPDLSFHQRSTNLHLCIFKALGNLFDQWIREIPNISSHFDLFSVVRFRIHSIFLRAPISRATFYLRRWGRMHSFHGRLRRNFSVKRRPRGPFVGQIRNLL